MLQLAVDKGVDSWVEEMKTSKEGLKEALARVQSNDVRYRFTINGYEDVYAAPDVWGNGERSSTLHGGHRAPSKPDEASKHLEEGHDTQSRSNAVSHAGVMDKEKSRGERTHWSWKSEGIGGRRESK
ncbi:oxidoreductase, zinc-binding [Marssonina coronariae]|uniref:Oxidoreductase, zinc-binding n=1 Tax=Diplocarpon coronariae TaxID=2795749 RepID=A0A218Z7U4_9HELO|nr:oxidoreductase, zinc-binding [Marssonina coronariae]